MDELTKEESSRKVDVEIAINELEQKLEDELQHQSIEVKAQAEAALKSRQTKERTMMLDMLMQNSQGEENDTI